jgi:hypothetical protein
LSASASNFSYLSAVSFSKSSWIRSR